MMVMATRRNKHSPPLDLKEGNPIVDTQDRDWVHGYEYILDQSTFMQARYLEAGQLTRIFRCR